MPRKVTDKIVSAFLAGQTAKQANTSTDGNSLYLHGNEIAKMKNGQLWVTNAGWFSNTTKERLNGIPGVSVYQKAGKWYLNDVEWDGKWISVGKPKTSAVEEVSRILKSIVKEEVIKAIQKKRRISEAVKGINLEQPHSNLYIKGWGLDSNGNWSIIVGFPNDRGFAIQTNGNLPETNSITKSSGRNLSDEDLDTIGREVTDYAKEYGSKNIKSRLRIYGSNKTESRLREGGNSEFSITYYATVGQHGEAGSKPDFKSALRAALQFQKEKDSEGNPMMDGLEYLGVEPIGDAMDFAVVFVQDSYIKHVNRDQNFNSAEDRKVFVDAAKRCLQTGKPVVGKFTETKV